MSTYTENTTGHVGSPTPPGEDTAGRQPSIYTTYKLGREPYQSQTGWRSHLKKGEKQMSVVYSVMVGLLKWLSGKESTWHAGDVGLIPGSGRCPGEGNGSPLQYSWLGNPMDKGAWQATVHGVARVGHD